MVVVMSPSTFNLHFMWHPRLQDAMSVLISWKWTTWRTVLRPNQTCYLSWLQSALSFQLSSLCMSEQLPVTGWHWQDSICCELSSQSDVSDLTNSHTTTSVLMAGQNEMLSKAEDIADKVRIAHNNLLLASLISFSLQSRATYYDHHNISVSFSF